MKKSDIRAVIQEEMRATFPEAEERVARFYAMQAYHLGWRDENLLPASFDAGKLLRPQLAILTCRAVGGEVAHALPLAAGIQLIHDFSLIHDDIEDQSDTRRGRVTVWKQWGLAHGINVGDGMFVVAHLALHRLADAGVAPALALEVIRRFDQTILTICEGQFLDLSFEGDLSIGEADYLAMIGRKTAALIACAAGLGAMVGEASEESVQALFDFGQNLGLSFQIQDDLLGIWGEPTLTGKPRAADICRRKVSLPIVHALRHATENATLERIYRQEQVSDDEVTQVLTVLEEAGSYRYSEQEAARHHRKALQALEQVQGGESSEAREALGHIRAMAEMLMGRQT
jgi:geranylgeranyl diphosphate synthase, type I